ncbi:MAG TPA: hypothetical protein VK952_06295 [Methylotenera sp.]|nr:hypothetical protein [Methylotenera sp.]
MADISVVETDTNTYQVTVTAQTTTMHLVTVQADYAQKLTNGRIGNTELLKKSFEFLLQRESNTSILRSFDLSVISRYFPEFEREIKA